MPTGQALECLTALQMLSFELGEDINSSHSPPYKTLQAGVELTAAHPKCVTVYWLQMKEDPRKVMIVSQWMEPVDFDVPKSYLPYLILHLDSRPAATIYLAHDLHTPTNFGITNFLTIYFPIRKCSHDFKKQIAATAKAFLHATIHTYSSPFECLRFATSGWAEGTKIVHGEVTNEFIFRLIWRDEQSEERSKRENEHWVAMMQYFKEMGMLGEEQFHEKAREARCNDHGDDVNEAISRQVSEEVKPTRTTEIATKKSWKCEGIVQTMPPMTAPILGVCGTQTRAWNNAEILCGVAQDDPRISARWKEEQKKAQDHYGNDLDIDSRPSTPILTPSSSTLSLNSHFDECKYASDLPDTWQSEYDISSPQHGLKGGVNQLKDDGDPKASVVNPPIRKPGYFLQRDESGRSDEEREVEIATSNLLINQNGGNPVSTLTVPVNNLISAENTEKNYSEQSYPKTQNTRSSPVMRRPNWDVDEELRNAKSRFWQRRKHFDSLTSRLETQIATPEGKSPPLSPPRRSIETDRNLKINPLRGVGPESQKRTSWYDYVKNCLPRQAASSTGEDIEARDVDLEDGEVDSEEELPA